MTLHYSPSLHTDQADNGDAGVSRREPLKPELVSRFRALIDEVTDELVRGHGADGDRDVCRADAITLLIASHEQLDDDAAPQESPLIYLLMEEQQKAATLLNRRLAAPAAGAPLLYLKA